MYREIQGDTERCRGGTRVASAVVHHEALDEARLHARPVLHVHDLLRVGVRG
jgi:hypothetical protein